MSQRPSAFWSLSQADLLSQLGSTADGLTSQEAALRLERFGPNLLAKPRRTDALSLLLGQFSSPIILLLLFASGLSFFLGEATDALIILAIVFISGALGFWQERGAANAVAQLLAVVRISTTAIRDGNPREVSPDEIVPGDVVILTAGASVPGDGLILTAKDLLVDEATLTGETFPVEKAPGVLSESTPLAERSNALFMGTHVVSGTAQAVIVRTGQSTEFGQIAQRLRLRPRETEFARGVRRFGYFLMEVTSLLVLAIFAINVYLERPVLESLLFALALAVGLTPQLLPAIISVNLSHGAKRMAARRVIVKRLASIEDFGSMDVFCSDKTGTLTEGLVRLHSALGVDGHPSEKVLLYAYLNAHFETGFTNPIDQAIRSYRPLDLSGYRKLDEVPYDFARKRLSVLIRGETESTVVTKGSVDSVLAVCERAETLGGEIVELMTARKSIDHQFADLSSRGLRVIGVAYRNLGEASSMTKEEEADMTFLGLVVFFDPPKPEAARALADLSSLGVTLKIITGDNRLVAVSVAEQVGLTNTAIVTGADLHRMSDEALLGSVDTVGIFAEVEPNQKERIVRALQRAGHVVGYLGDGINDAPALHAAEVGISVNSAADVAKEAAEIVLLDKDLGVLVEGIQEGRATFVNTLKYIFMATSANFGNMFSMAGASLFLPFLPLLPKQILLLNLLTDLPEMTIATDSVDREWVHRARRWDVGFIRRFMLVFGPLSSLFDFLTFGALLLLLGATPDQLRTGWFVESLISAALVVLVIRTQRPFLRSRPSSYLLLATVLVVACGLSLPLIPLGALLNFVPLPPTFLVTIGAIVALYVIAAEATKRVFYQRSSY